MQKLDRATLLELEWRDFFFWPITRPLGILWEYILMGLSILLRFSHQRDAIIRKELFTLANLMSIYGLFLIGELFYVIFAWANGSTHIGLWSAAAWFFDLNAPDLWTASWLVTEIVLTDLIDGPLARTNARISALGTFLDHTRDYIISFVALALLVAVAAMSRDWALLALTIASITGLLLFTAYHIIFFKKVVLRDAWMFRDGMLPPAQRWSSFFKHALLEEYQTNLTGRIHFTALAFTIGSGLFYYATEAGWIHITFIASLIFTIIITTYYLYELWGTHYHRWEAKTHEKSQHLKKKLVERIERRVKN